MFLLGSLSDIPLQLFVTVFRIAKWDQSLGLDLSQDFPFLHSQPIFGGFTDVHLVTQICIPEYTCMTSGKQNFMFQCLLQPYFLQTVSHFTLLNSRLPIGLHNCNWAVPAEATHPPTMRLPSPCFTVGTKFFSVSSVSGLHQTGPLFWYPNNLVLNSSVQRGFFLEVMGSKNLLISKATLRFEQLNDLFFTRFQFSLNLISTDQEYTIQIALYNCFWTTIE